MTALHWINEPLSTMLKGSDPCDQTGVDKILRQAHFLVLNDYVAKEFIHMFKYCSYSEKATYRVTEWVEAGVVGGTTTQNLLTQLCRLTQSALPELTL